MKLSKLSIIKIFSSLVSWEFYFLKTIGWAFFLFGFYSLFQPIITDKPSSFSLIEILSQSTKEKGIRFWVVDNDMREALRFRVLFYSFFPIIIGSILLLKNNTKA